MPRKKGITVPITTQNKDVTTTFKFVFGHHPDISVDEQRVLARILEFASLELQGKLMKDEIRNFKRSEWGAVNMELNVKDFMLSSEGWSHEYVQGMLNRLSRRFFTYEDDKVWTQATYIAEPFYEKGTGRVTFTVPKLMWWAMKNFVGGYREFELNKALALPTTYSFRFYLLMSGQKKPFEFSIEKLFEWLAIPLKDTAILDKDGMPKIVKAAYRDKNGKFRIDNIEAKVIKPAKEILDKTCPYTFDYTKLKENERNPRSRVIGFRFYPVYQPKFRDQELEKKELLIQIPGKALLDKEIYNYLTAQIGFTKEEVNRNKEILIEAQRTIPDLVYELSLLKGKSRDKKNPKGYIINALKGKVKDKE
jgi:hypothetical protein